MKLTIGETILTATLADNSSVKALEALLKERSPSVFFSHELCAKYCMNVIDAGVAVLSMHAPYEVTSKFDIYTAYRGYTAFWK